MQKVLLGRDVLHQKYIRDSSKVWRETEVPLINADAKSANK